MRTQLLVPVLALVAAACGAASGAVPVAEKFVPVRVAVVMSAGTSPVTATGTLGAKDEIPLSFKIGGVVARVAVDEGARVHKGDVLAELDLREIDAAVAKATLGAEKARRDLARVERLYHDSVATLVQRQDAQTARDAAEQDLRSALVNREYAVINAPSDGVILRRVVNAGAQIGSAATVLTFGSATRGNVLRSGLADRDVVRVRDGDAAQVTFDAYPGRDFNGRVRQIGASSDPRTGTYTVEVALDDAAALPSGLVGRVTIAARASASATVASDAVSVPAEALVEGSGDRGVVYTLDATQHIAIRRIVTLAGLDGSRVLVRGLSGATHVITSGAAWLRDSMRVEVKP